MTWADSPASARRQVRLLEVVAVALFLVGVGFLAVGVRGHETAPTALSRELTGGPGQPPGALDGGPGVGKPGPSGPKPTETHAPVVARSVPVRIRIPAINVDADVTSLGLKPDDTVQVPADPAETGWYRLGVTPGQVGSAVILGHVDSVNGPAVFVLLRYLDRGDRVVVRLADGVVAHFRVTKVATYPNAQFPAQRVYGSHGHGSNLQLVTCGGDYDSTRGGYQSNVVAYTSLVRTSPGTGPGGSAA